MTGNNSLWQNFYGPVRQNDRRGESVTQPLLAALIFFIDQSAIY